MCACVGVLLQDLASAEQALEAVLEGVKEEVEGYHKELSQVGLDVM